MEPIHVPTPRNGRRISLYPRRWSGTAAVLLALLLDGEGVQSQSLSFRTPEDLLAGGPAALVGLLESSRPAPLSTEDLRATLRALPAQGEVTDLGAAADAKVDAVRQLLTATRREWYQIKVVDLPQAALALHARAVILISAPALALLSAAERRALAAHEIGHEYVWTEWNRAHQEGDQKRLKELELVCDAIAVVTLRGLGSNPSMLVDALEKIDRFNRARFGRAANKTSYPTLAERRAFARRLAKW